MICSNCGGYTQYSFFVTTKGNVCENCMEGEK